jgi:di/tricarboxylate transporter
MQITNQKPSLNLFWNPVKIIILMLIQKIIAENIKKLKIKSNILYKIIHFSEKHTLYWLVIKLRFTPHVEK